MVKKSATGTHTFSLQNDDRVHNGQAFWKGAKDVIPNLIRFSSVQKYSIL